MPKTVRPFVKLALLAKAAVTKFDEISPTLPTAVYETVHVEVEVEVEVEAEGKTTNKKPAKVLTAKELREKMLEERKQKILAQEKVKDSTFTNNNYN